MSAFESGGAAGTIIPYLEVICTTSKMFTTELPSTSPGMDTRIEPRLKTLLAVFLSLLTGLAEIYTP
jgi:hypothetical protein